IEGGVTRHVLDIARFDPCGGVGVVLPPWPGLDRAAAVFAHHGIPILRLAPAPRPGGVGDWLAQRPAQPGTSHFAASGEGAAAVDAALRAELVTLSTDHFWPGPSPDVAALTSRRASSRRQAAVLADSGAIRAALEPLLQPRVRVVRHGIDGERFSAMPR